MKKIYFRYAMNFFKKGMALSLLIFLGLIARAQSPISAQNASATAECTYTLSATGKAVTENAGANQHIEVTTGDACSWRAVSNADWIWLTTGQSETGSGRVSYSYYGNTSSYPRTGTITIADKTYTVTQAALLSDGYEPNNTVADAWLLPLPTPPFTQSVSAVINIASASCHVVRDVDYYKIELPAGVSYIFSAELYDRRNPHGGNSPYTLTAKISYSTDNGTTWSDTADIRSLRAAAPAGILYLKIEPYSNTNHSGNAGTYAAKIDLNIAATVGCNYALTIPTSRTVTAEAATNHQQVEVTTGAACFWAAVSNADWITITAGQSGTGTGRVNYSYTENTTFSSRTGIITVAGQEYTVTQAAHLPDRYEPNNTVAEAKLLPLPIQPFAQNIETLTISPANCHVLSDIDIYKVELPPGASYIFNAQVYDSENQRDNSRYTLDAQMSYSTDSGGAWSATVDKKLPRVIVQGGTLYLKIEPRDSGYAGTYAAKIDLSIAATAGCTYDLTATNKQVTADEGAHQQIVVTATGATCFWTAVSDVSWITLTSGQSGTGSRSVYYSYTANATSSSRTGTITIADKTYTVTQASHLPDRYEPNNTVAEARVLPLPTPLSAQNVRTVINISPANCHVAGDRDYYKIALPAGYSYIFSAELYDKDSRQNNNYTLNASIAYSTNGSSWSLSETSRLSNVIGQGKSLYLSIQPFHSTRDVGSYAVKVDLRIAAVAGCTYTLSARRNNVTGDASTSNQQVEVRTEGTCFWAAASNDDWITLTAGQSGTGSGTVSYSYSKNWVGYSRTGTITIAGETYTVTQGPTIPRPLPPDSYESNDTKETATPLTAIFNENASALTISSVNCHAANDVDYYKIELDAAYSYVFSAECYAFGSGRGYTLNAEMSYSTNGSTWNFPPGFGRRVPSVIVPGGTLYLKIQSEYSVVSGTYAVKINLRKSTTSGCTYTLSDRSKNVTADAANQQVEVTATEGACFWAAFSNANWITLTAGQSGTGTGSVAYSCKANRAVARREGTITIAGQTYTVTQAGRPLLPDGYEQSNGHSQNNTASEAYLFTPAFIQGASVIDISSATCHVASDIDIYKIELPAGSSCFFSAQLYDSDNQNDNSNYTLNANISYSTDGSTWSSQADIYTPSVLVPEGTFYLKIESRWGLDVGTYAAKINLRQYATAGCTYALSSPSLSASADRGANQVGVTASGTSCAWAAFSNETWLTLTAGQSGIGSGNVAYSYTENTGLSSRSGIITIAGQTYTVTQAPRLPPLDRYEPNNTALQAYAFIPKFIQNASVITISSATFHEVGDVDYYEIALSAGYSYLVSAEARNLDSQNNNNRIFVYPQLSYSIDNGVTLRSLTYGELLNVAASGGRLYLKTEPTSSSVERVCTYTATINLRKLASAGCAYTLSATSHAVTAEAANQQVTVTTEPSCFWAAFSNANWITLTAAQSGIGSGSIAYSCKANMEEASRTGTITIAGQTYTVTQAARPLLPDEYEQSNGHSQNNTTLEAYSFTPFAQNENATVIDISPASCHVANDIDIYKIELPAGHSYLFSARVYNAYSQSDNSNHTLYARMFYSTDGIEWGFPMNSLLPRMQVQEGTLYLKIEPFNINNRVVGTYAVRINLRKSASIGCSYTLSPEHKDVTEEAGSNQVEVTTSGSSCPWTAVSNDNWITLTAASGSGAGSVRYSYEANRETVDRRGTITIANKTYTLIQEGRPLLPDAYEQSAEHNRNNNTASQAYSFTPAFTQSASVIDISSATCHEEGDVDVYKINLPSGSSYQVSAELYDKDYHNNNNNNNHTLDVKISYSTDGSTWSNSENSQLPSMTVQGGSLYLKIEPFSSGNVGTYAAKINITALCAYEAPSRSQQVTSPAAIGQVEVRTISICAWEASSNVPWITIPAGQELVGAKNLDFSYEANLSSIPRTGIMTVAGGTVTVTQAGVACSYTIPPTPISVPSAAGTGKVSVTATSTANDCTWTATTTDPWITIPTGQTLVGTKELNFSYEANPTSVPRTGSITVEGQTVTVIQAGTTCSYTLSSAPIDVGLGQGEEKVLVTATATDCVWTATPNAPWITVLEGQTLVGTKKLKFSHEPNPKREPRTGTITVAGGTVTVTQAGGYCFYILSPAAISATSAAGTGKVLVIAESTSTISDCLWIATPNVPWITIPVWQTLIGTKELRFSYAANPTNEPREGTITIAGETFTVRQSSVTTGFETASPVKIFPNPAKDFVTIEVSSSNQEWTSLKITNIFGQALYERTNPEHKMQIPLTGFSSGLYFVVLQGKEKTAVQKLIIE